MPDVLITIVIAAIPAGLILAWFVWGCLILAEMADRMEE